MPKVSIIIPIYNVEEYIEKALNSVYEQSLSDIEIICVDDCSKDKSREIVQEYTNKDKRFKLISLDKNKGQGIARNIGIQQAQGEYLMFLDPDDWYAKNTCEIAYNNISSHSGDIATFNFFRYYEKDNKLEILNLSNTLRPIEGCSTKHIYRTQFIKENNIEFGTGRNCEDNPFFLKAMILTDKISLINIPLYYYRTRKNHSSSRRTFGNCLDILDSKNKCYEIIKDKRNLVKDWGLVYVINSTLINFDKYYKKFKNKDLKKKFYNKTRELFIKIKNDDFYKNNFSKDINYRDFNKIVKNNYYQYNTINFIQKNIIEKLKMTSL